MPTGYTARIHDGEQVTFPEFAMTCARAFGALVEMRDEAPGAPVPEEFKPAPFYAEHLQRARQKLAEVEAWTDGEAQAHAAAEHAEAAREIGKSNAVARILRERYEALLAEVEAWQPPTPEHQGLKDFMAKQLQDSADFDCREMEIPEALGGEEYRRQALDCARRDLERAEEGYADEVQRQQGRTEWVRALRASLATAAGS